MPYTNTTRRDRAEAAGLDEGQDDEQAAHELDEEEEPDPEEGIAGVNESKPGNCLMFVTPFRIVVENIAVVWGIVAEKHKFFVVKKALTTEIV